jgi:prepilin-type processing-associated H-X9-DG protein
VEKYTEISQPATKYVFVEEADPRGWNPGSWVLDPVVKAWVDPLAVWHSNSRSTLGYADGHAEIHPWVDKSTIEMSRDQVFDCPVPANEGEDLHFMLAGFPQKAPDSSTSRAP